MHRHPRPCLRAHAADGTHTRTHTQCMHRGANEPPRYTSPRGVEDSAGYGEVAAKGGGGIGAALTGGVVLDHGVLDGQSAAIEDDCVRRRGGGAGRRVS